MSDQGEHWHGWCPTCRAGKTTAIAGPRCWNCGTTLENPTHHEGWEEAERPVGPLKSVTYAVRFTPEQVAAIRQTAGAAEQRPTAWVRSLVLAALHEAGSVSHDDT